MLKITRYIQPQLCRTVHQLEPFGNHEDLSAVFTELRDYHSWLSKREFRQKYRVPQHLFLPLVDIIKQTPTFHNWDTCIVPGPKPRSVAFHVAVFLFFVGRQYSAADRGTGPLYCHHVVAALMHLQPLYLRWPDAA
jgi:hypothetical protein